MVDFDSEYSNYSENWEYASTPNDEMDLFKKNDSYLILKPEDLSEIENLRNNVITETQEFTSLSRDNSIKLLIYFKWNLDQLKDKFYDDSDKYQILSGIKHSNSSILELKKLNVKPGNKECLVCFAEDEEDNKLISLDCKHFFCSDCWEGHLGAKISNINSLLASLCPQQGCSILVPESMFTKFFKDKKQSEVYKKSLYKNFLENNSEIKWCPNNNCGAFIRCSIAAKEIECICGEFFCFKCLKEGHRPCNCDMTQKWEKKLKSESENVKWIHANTKECPKCRKYIEKNQGCNHMTCRKEAGGCGHEFCWLCFSDWKNHQACNKFIDEQTTKKQNESKIELQKYIFYFDRYNNHDKALKLAKRLKRSIEYYIQVFNEIKNIPLHDLYFLNDAIEGTIKSRKFLKFSYIFGYYIQESKKKEKMLFEHKQSLLEANCDRLHELLENETMTTILALIDFQDFQDEFKNYKNTIIDLCAATNKFSDNLITEIENNLLHLIDNKKFNEN